MVEMESKTIKINPVSHHFEPLSPEERQSLEQFFDKKEENETEKLEIQAELEAPGSDLDVSDDEQDEDESELASPSKKQT